MRRLLAIALLFVLPLTLSTATAGWDPPCGPIPAAAAGSGVYTRIIRNPSAVTGWLLSTSAATTFTRTYVLRDPLTHTAVISTDVRLLGFTPYTIARDDLEYRFDASEPFMLWRCAPGTSPYTFLPLIR